MKLNEKSPKYRCAQRNRAGLTAGLDAAQIGGRGVVLLAALLVSGSFAFAQVQQQLTGCEVDTVQPPDHPDAALGYSYRFEALEGVDDISNTIVYNTTTPKHGPWATLAACACGWYGVNQTCPPCIGTTETTSSSTTITWSISNASESTLGLSLALRGILFGDVGFSGSLKSSNQNSTSGSQTDSVTLTLTTAPSQCFIRYYRKSWTLNEVSRLIKRQYTYRWREIDLSGEPTANSITFPCTVDVQAKSTYSTSPYFEYAPQQPPCGGVPVTTNDPWGTRREQPCCTTICPPPHGQNYRAVAASDSDDQSSVPGLTSRNPLRSKLCDICEVGVSSS